MALHHHHDAHDVGIRPRDYGRAFGIGIALNTAFIVAEVVYGLKADSLALLADAGHNVSDVLALLLALGANVLAARRPSPRFTYGLRSSTILAALLNAALLLVAMGGIGWEAIQRFTDPKPVQGGIVIGVAVLGAVINGVTAWLFMADRNRDINIRAAFAHMAADAAVSVGVAIAGLVILYTGWLWIDSAVSLLVVVVIVIGTWSLLRESLGLALHAVPPGVEPDAVRAYFASLPGVCDVHDLHIWGMSTTERALTVHLVMPAGHPGDDFIARLARDLHDKFHIGHPTIQVETGDPAHPCTLAPEHVV